jgi:hypothetical protein
MKLRTLSDQIRSEYPMRAAHLPDEQREGYEKFSLQVLHVVLDVETGRSRALADLKPDRAFAAIDKLVSEATAKLAELEAQNTAIRERAEQARASARRLRAQHPDMHTELRADFRTLSKLDRLMHIRSTSSVEMVAALQEHARAAPPEFALVPAAELDAAAERLGDPARVAEAKALDKLFDARQGLLESVKLGMKELGPTVRV